MEKPIIFKGDMVNAILEGRKTQTRRIVKGVPEGSKDVIFNPSHFEPDYGFYFKPHGGFFKCPYGKVGDQLWVRETFAGPLIPEEKETDYWELGASAFESPEYCAYKASGDSNEFFDLSLDETVSRWTPSIYMPRWASRIQLEITDIRVERLNDISEQDARAEGIQKIQHGHVWKSYLSKTHNGFHCPIACFQTLWESINGKGSWDENPWVWVIEFKKLEENKNG